MHRRVIDATKIQNFSEYLSIREKSPSTIEKYLRDVRSFFDYVKGRELMKTDVLSYKEMLVSKNYAVSSINSMISSLNSFFIYCGWTELKVGFLRVQRKIFCSQEEEMTVSEYKALVKAARKRKNDRLALIIETLCATGIRVSELRYITVQAVVLGETAVTLKGKTRMIFIVRKLQKKLLTYAKMNNIREGNIFITRNRNPISRTNIWKEMKNLCRYAGVNPKKVFPHNLRHLFARIFYNRDKDIAKLADILGHSSIDTTRVYIISSGDEHRRRMEQMRLII